MKLYNPTKRRSFWSEVLRLSIPLFFAFFIIIFLMYGTVDDLLAGNFSEVIKKTFVGMNGLTFIGSVVVATFFGSLVITAYDREEIRNEKN